MPVAGSTLVAAQRSIRLVTFSRTPDAVVEHCADEVEFRPGASPSTCTLPRNRKGSTGAPTTVLERPHAREVDERDEATPRIREAEALGRGEHLWRSAQFARA